MAEKPVFELEFLVRDYEVDLQGIVNNSVYQNYLEHARHEYLFTKNVDFAKLHEEGKDLVVSSVEIKYKTPLKSRDRFIVTIRPYKEGNLKIVFEQNIYRLPDKKLVVTANIAGVCLLKGRPVKPEDILDLTLLDIL
ncbi:MAG: acyl-CoA thioesterase [Bacteroidota bacterium]